jgi:hypothetical protein
VFAKFTLLLIAGCAANVAETASIGDRAVSVAPADSLRRLSMTQYANSVRDLVRSVLGDGPDADSVLAQATLDLIPADRREPLPQDLHGSYRRLDQSLEQIHVDATYRVAGAIAAALTQPERLERVVGACALDDDADNDRACLQQFLERFGAQALRRPLAADDFELYREVYGHDATSSAAAYADVIHVLLCAPELLYFVEHGAHAVADQPGLVELSDFELASRLSYHFWQTKPDDELWRAAMDGSLHKPGVYERQVERLVSDPRTRQTLREFYADWLKVEDLPAFGQAQDPLYRAFAQPNTVTAQLRQDMIDDVLDMLDYYTWTQPAGLSALFTSPLSFARSAELAAIYGSEPWDGVVTPPRMPEAQRAGLLTRALFLANASPNTRPIMKGVFIRRRLLCDDIPPPPAGVNAVPPALRPDMTTRQVVEALTEQPDSQCAVCHATLINPLGFITESFDALGRFRTQQQLFEADGTSAGSLPVDTHVRPQVTAGDVRGASGADDLAALMLQSGKLELCFARNYFRFTFGRWEDDAFDASVLERLRARLVETESLEQMLREVVFAPEFRRRRFAAADSGGEHTP